MTARHGSHAGYTKHMRDGTEVCDACRTAERLYQRRRRADRPAAQERYQWSRRKALQDLADNHRSEYEFLRNDYLRAWDDQQQKETKA